MPSENIREVRLSDLDRCYEIETAAYEGDEAASREKIQTRIEIWPAGFIVLEHNGQVAGFINSGAAFDVEMSDEAFKELKGHDPDGPNVVIMSVAVDPEFQRQGMAGRLLTAFIERMHSAGKQRILLICQTRLIDMYASHGFEYLGESASEHGGLSWHEMTLTL